MFLYTLSGSIPKEHKWRYMFDENEKALDGSNPDFLAWEHEKGVVGAIRLLAPRLSSVPVSKRTGISFRFKIQNPTAYFLTASPNTRRKFPPPIFPISSCVKPVFNMASTTT